METLISAPPHEDSLPMDLVVDILCRLPVKFLLQFRSVCKLRNSLISSDLKFAKKHLHLSTTRSLNFFCYSDCRYIFESRPLDSLFSTMSMDVVTQFEYPRNLRFPSYYLSNVVGSCNGILCLAHYLHDCFVLVWNPSIRKFKELPLVQKQKFHDHSGRVSLSFGYDHVNDNYKVVIVLKYSGFRRLRFKTQVRVFTFRTNLWKVIGQFPFGCVPFEPPGTFVCGTINWLASKSLHRKIPCLIVSFNLENESFREILAVLRDCLCMISGCDVWLMKEYGNKESWTKLLTISYDQNPSDSYDLSKVVCMFADDHVFA